MTEMKRRVFNPWRFVFVVRHDSLESSTAETVWVKLRLLAWIQTFYESRGKENTFWGEYTRVRGKGMDVRKDQRRDAEAATENQEWGGGGARLDRERTNHIYKSHQLQCDEHLSSAYRSEVKVLALLSKSEGENCLYRRFHNIWYDLTLKNNHYYYYYY